MTHKPVIPAPLAGYAEKPWWNSGPKIGPATAITETSTGRFHHPGGGGIEHIPLLT